MKINKFTKIIGLTFLLLIITGLAVVSVQPVKAQDKEISDPGITPDNYLYGIDRAMESIHMSVTENRSEKAQLGLEFAEERLSEGMEMSFKGKTGLAKRMANEYQDQFNESMNFSEELPNPQRERIQQMLANKTTHHIQVMERVRDKVPSHAKPAIQEAMNNSKRGRGQALGQLSEIAPQKSAEMRYQYAQDLAYELQKLALKIEIEAEVQENGTNVELEINDTEETVFLEEITEKDEVVNQISQLTNLSTEEVNKYIEFKEEEELEIEATVTADTTNVKIESSGEETSFSIDAVDRDQVVEEIEARTNYSSSQIYRNLELDDDRDITIDWSIRNNQSRIYLTIEDESLNFTIANTSATEVIEAIQERTDLTATTIREEIREALVTKERAREYTEEINLTTDLIERAQEMGINITELQEKLANSTSRNLGALVHAYNKAPEPAKNALVHAMNASMKGQNMALEQIREKNPNHAEEIEKGMPPWAQEMRNNWKNNNFNPGKGPKMNPGMPGMAPGHGGGRDGENNMPGMSGSGNGDSEDRKGNGSNSEMGPRNKEDQDKSNNDGEDGENNMPGMSGSGNRGNQEMAPKQEQDGEQSEQGTQGFDSNQPRDNGDLGKVVDERGNGGSNNWGLFN